MNRNEDTYLLEILHLAQELLILADEGEAHAADDRRCILFGVIRDAAFKIQAETEKEQSSRKERGNEDGPGHSHPPETDRLP